MTEKRNSTRARAICLATHLKYDEQRQPYMVCTCTPACKMRFNPAKTAWRADHARRWAEGGRDTPDNLFPILTAHDIAVKAPNDTREVAKGKRFHVKHFGGRAPKGRPMAGSRLSGWKKRMDGTVVRRNGKDNDDGGE